MLAVVQGRFQIYEPGLEPPPLSPIAAIVPTPSAAQSLATMSVGSTSTMGGVEGLLAGSRVSEDGARR